MLIKRTVLAHIGFLAGRVHQPDRCRLSNKEKKEEKIDVANLKIRYLQYHNPNLQVIVVIVITS